MEQMFGTVTVSAVPRGDMGKDDKEYDAFEIFEEIQEQEGTGAGQPLLQPLLQGQSGAAVPHAEFS